MAKTLKNRKVNITTQLPHSGLRVRIHGIIVRVYNEKGKGQAVYISTRLNPKGIKFSRKEIGRFIA